MGNVCSKILIGVASVALICISFGAGLAAGGFIMAGMKGALLGAGVSSLLGLAAGNSPWTIMKSMGFGFLSGALGHMASFAVVGQLASSVTLLQEIAHETAAGFFSGSVAHGVGCLVYGRNFFDGFGVVLIGSILNSAVGPLVRRFSADIFKAAGIVISEAKAFIQSSIKMVAMGLITGFKSGVLASIVHFEFDFFAARNTFDMSSAINDLDDLLTTKGSAFVEQAKTCGKLCQSAYELSKSPEHWHEYMDITFGNDHGFVVVHNAHDGKAFIVHNTKSNKLFAVGRGMRGFLDGPALSDVVCEDVRSCSYGHVMDLSRDMKRLGALLNCSELFVTGHSAGVKRMIGTMEGLHGDVMWNAKTMTHMFAEPTFLLPATNSDRVHSYVVPGDFVAFGAHMGNVHVLRPLKPSDNDGFLGAHSMDNFIKNVGSRPLVLESVTPPHMLVEGISSEYMRLATASPSTGTLTAVTCEYLSRPPSVVDTSSRAPLPQQSSPPSNQQQHHVDTLVPHDSHQRRCLPILRAVNLEHLVVQRAATLKGGEEEYVFNCAALSTIKAVLKSGADSPVVMAVVGDPESARVFVKRYLTHMGFYIPMPFDNMLPLGVWAYHVPTTRPLIILESQGFLPLQSWVVQVSSVIRVVVPNDITSTDSFPFLQALHLAVKHDVVVRVDGGEGPASDSDDDSIDGGTRQERRRVMCDEDSPQSNGRCLEVDGVNVSSGHGVKVQLAASGVSPAFVSLAAPGNYVVEADALIEGFLTFSATSIGLNMNLPCHYLPPDQYSVFFEQSLPFLLGAIRKEMGAAYNEIGRAARELLDASIKRVCGRLEDKCKENEDLAEDVKRWADCDLQPLQNANGTLSNFTLAFLKLAALLVRHGEDEFACETLSALTEYRSFDESSVCGNWSPLWIELFLTGEFGGLRAAWHSRLSKSCLHAWRFAAKILQNREEFAERVLSSFPDFIKLLLSSLHELRMVNGESESEGEQTASVVAFAAYTACRRYVTLARVTSGSLFRENSKRFQSQPHPGEPVVVSSVDILRELRPGVRRCRVPPGVSEPQPFRHGDPPLIGEDDYDFVEDITTMTLFWSEHLSVTSPFATAAALLRLTFHELFMTPFQQQSPTIASRMDALTVAVSQRLTAQLNADTVCLDSYCPHAAEIPLRLPKEVSTRFINEHRTLLDGLFQRCVRNTGSLPKVAQPTALHLAAIIVALLMNGDSASLRSHWLEGNPGLASSDVATLLTLCITASGVAGGESLDDSLHIFCHLASMLTHNASRRYHNDLDALTGVAKSTLASSRCRTCIGWSFVIAWNLQEHKRHEDEIRRSGIHTVAALQTVATLSRLPCGVVSDSALKYFLGADAPPLSNVTQEYIRKAATALANA